MSKYKELISKSVEEVNQEQQDLQIEQVKIEYAHGLLSIESNILNAKKETSQAEVTLGKAKAALEAAKGGGPDNYVQKIVDAKQAVTKAEFDLESKKEAAKEIDELKAYLVDLQEELF
jgi:hypothetical protein